MGVVGLDLPLTLGVNVGLHQDGGLYVSGDSKLELVLRTMNGRIVAYVDSLVYSDESTAVDWPGRTLPPT
jgi:hypothetical protein